MPQAILLNDTHQLSVAENWIDTLLSRQTAEGWLGPPLAERGDAGMIYWPQWPIVLTFMAWREYTVTVRGAEDPRLIAASLAWLHNASGLMDVRPMGRDWSGTRWQDFVQAIQAIQDCPSTPASEQPFLAQLAQKVYDQGTKNGIDWAKFYTPGNPEFPTDAVGGWDYLPHGVNNA